MTNQSDLQASIRALSGSAYDYNSDWETLFDVDAIPTGRDFNGRQLAWLNAALGTFYPDLSGARAAYAASQGLARWDDVVSLTGRATRRFSFVSTGVQYVSRTCVANAVSTAAWTIEGVNVGLNPGTVALAGDKSVIFDCVPIGRLSTFNCNTNTLTGSFPNLQGATQLVTLDVGANALTGGISRLDDCIALQSFACGSNAALGGAIPSLAGCPALLTWGSRSCGLTGGLPSWASNPLLTSVDVALNSLTGPVTTLSGNPALTSFNARNNLLDGPIMSMGGATALTAVFLYANKLSEVDAAFAVAPALGDFEAQDNLLTQASVDRILRAFVAAGRTTGTRVLNLGGTGNSAPSATGLTDKAALVAAGWTVTTN